MLGSHFRALNTILFFWTNETGVWCIRERNKAGRRCSARIDSLRRDVNRRANVCATDEWGRLQRECGVEKRQTLTCPESGRTNYVDQSVVKSTSWAFNLRFYSNLLARIGAWQIWRVEKGSADWWESRAGPQPGKCQICLIYLGRFILLHACPYATATCFRVVQ